MYIINMVFSQVRKQLNSVGYYSDAESVRTNGLPTPTASTPTCSPLPVATPTPTPNGRGSSADSGVRVSSDRESTASHDGEILIALLSRRCSPMTYVPLHVQLDFIFEVDHIFSFHYGIMKVDSGITQHFGML